MFPIHNIVNGVSLSARHISQAIKAPVVVVIPICLALVVTTLFAFPNATHKSCCLGNNKNGTSFLRVASNVLR